MVYGIGVVEITGGPFPVRVRLVNVPTRQKACLGQAFCLKGGTAAEGDTVLVKFIPEDQFCQLVDLGGFVQ